MVVVWLSVPLVPVTVADPSVAVPEAVKVRVLVPVVDAGLKLAVGKYVGHYQLTADRLKLAKSDAIVMHPGPMLRGMEIQSEVADSPQSVIEEQVHNGVYVRMAILTLCMGMA